MPPPPEIGLIKRACFVRQLHMYNINPISVYFLIFPLVGYYLEMFERQNCAQILPCCCDLNMKYIANVARLAQYWTKWFKIVAFQLQFAGEDFFAFTWQR